MAHLGTEWERRQMVRWRKAGASLHEVARRLERGVATVKRWWSQFRQHGVAGLRPRSRQPRRLARALPTWLRGRVLAIRRQLRRAAQRGQGFAGIGAEVVRLELVERRVEPVPSLRTIERWLEVAGMTGPAPRRAKGPRLPAIFPVPTRPGVAHSTDAVGPRYLRGPQGVTRYYSLHTVDLGAHAPVATQHPDKSAGTLVEHLVGPDGAWRMLGVPRRWHQDNTMSAAGSPRHPWAFSAPVRLALLLGIQPVFIPAHEVGWQAEVESFNGYWQARVVGRHRCPTLTALRATSRGYQDYVWEHKPHRQLSVALHGTRFPGSFLRTHPGRPLPRGVRLTRFRDAQGHYHFPLARGRITWIVHADEDGQCRVLGQTFRLGRRAAHEYVQATLYTGRRRLVLKLGHRVCHVQAWHPHEVTVRPWLCVPRGRN